MISASSLVLDEHHGHGLGPGPGPGPGSLHHMTFVDPYVRSKLPSSVPEFMGPFAKPAPLVPRFNGQRPSPSQSPRKDYPIVPVSTTSVSGPMNLSSGKLESGKITGENHISTSVNIQVPHLTAGYGSRMYPPPAFPYPSLQNPYGSLYPSSYSSLLSRPTYIGSTPLSPLDSQFSPPPKTNGGGPNSPDVFIQPPGSYANPNPIQSAPPPPPPPATTTKTTPSLLREKRPFKVPSCKETNGRQRLLSSGKNTAKRVTLTSNVNNNNNNLLPPNFTKGSLIQLANGDLRRVEDVTTEELVSSAEKCPAFRLDPSTVVRITENNNGTVLLTLSYGENKKTKNLLP
ncbi:conserved hypothetical protein [Pediculus humanus corporis]|uniref:AXH domain-containing protein n=1 Tax=Pediculus humanus subsp. corporis TaxID=121224 RepID=E0VLV4_PEDHC|nr:uncharacterized protein Phum_PHUM294400 [Pediculus humanus corporis]EEB14360.1 conserved hypothetical protein [Pediculus humanus corporis]